MSDYKVQLERFEGPLDLLLQLIEAQELDITEVSLAQVTDQYIERINSMEGLEPEEIADFLVIVARLLYIKSKVLLPTLDLDDDGVDLEAQLRMYKAFVEASKKLEKRYASAIYSFARTKYPILIEPTFNPPSEIDAGALASAFAKVLRRLEPLRKLPEKMMEKIVHLSEKIQQIRDIIIKESNSSFNALISQAETKTEKVVTFLALLELVKQKTVVVDQQALFEDIQINKAQK